MLDYASKKDDKYAHLSEEQLTQIQNTLHQKETWLRNQVHAQDALPLNADPVCLTEQIVAQHQAFESTCRPIANTPKPAPPSPPPPPPAPAESEKTNNNSNGGAKHNVGKNASPGKKKAAENNDSVKPEMMDVD